MQLKHTHSESICDSLYSAILGLANLKGLLSHLPITDDSSLQSRLVILPRLSIMTQTTHMYYQHLNSVPDLTTYITIGASMSDVEPV
jgi:hypothetical protein